MTNDFNTLARTILAQNERLIALLEAPEAPAKPAPAKPRKARKARKAATPPVQAPVQNAQRLTGAQRKAWNDKFVALARFSGLRDARGVSLYRVAMNRWTEVQHLRDEQGAAPEEVLHILQVGKTWARKA